MDRTEELKASEAALSGEIPMQKAKEDLVKNSITYGYDPLTGMLSLLLDLEPARGNLKLDAFSATLKYEPNGGWGGSGKPRLAYSHASAMNTDQIRTSLAMNKPDRGPLQCSWEIIVLVRVSINDWRRWEKKGSFVG